MLTSLWKQLGFDGLAKAFRQHSRHRIPLEARLRKVSLTLMPNNSPSSTCIKPLNPQLLTNTPTCSGAFKHDTQSNQLLALESVELGRTIVSFERTPHLMTPHQFCLQLSFMNPNPAGFSRFTMSNLWEKVNQIAFPVPGCKSIIGLTGALATSCHIRNLSSAIDTSRAWPTSVLALPQTGNQLCSKLTARHHVDRVINRLTGHGLGGIISKHPLECARNLLRRPAFPKVMPNHIKENQVRRESGSAPLHASQLTSPITSKPSNVSTALGGIALYLTTDRRAATTKRPGNPLGYSRSGPSSP